MAKPLLIAITPGDPEGIGPEVTWKALKKHPRSSRVALFCIGAESPWRKLRAPVVRLTEADLTDRNRLSRRVLGSRSTKVWLLPAPEQSSHFLPGFQCGWSIAEATRLVRQGFADALVTGPISKERLQAGGYPFPGHTEFLAHLSSDDREPPAVTMMLANDELRISLVTIHLGLAQVWSAIS